MSTQTRSQIFLILAAIVIALALSGVVAYA